MALRVGELYALLKLEDREFQRGLQRAEQDVRKFDRSLQTAIQRLDSYGNKLNQLGKDLTAKVTLPLAGLSAYLVKTASDAAETASKFEVSFGDMAEASMRLADQLARDQQRARVHLQNMMADAQAILAPMTENREAAAAMSAALAALAVDLGSFLNLADREAFDRLISGLLGSTEATERLGISLRESQLQLEAQRLGIEANTAAMTDGEKIMLRFIAIMRQSADAQTDAIRTAASFENQLKALKADVADLAAEMGQELLPYALALVQVGRDLVQHWRSLSPEAKELAFQMAALAAAVGPLALGLSAIVRAGAGVGRVLALIATVSRRHPLVLLASLATMAALSVEEVRVKLNELGRTIGLGDILDELEDLQEAFQELMSFEIDFDPEGASAEALERQKQLYQQAMEEIQQALREGFKGAAELAEEGAAQVAEAFDPWALIRQATPGVVPFDLVQKAILGLDPEDAEEVARILERLNRDMSEGIMIQAVLEAVRYTAGLTTEVFDASRRAVAEMELLEDAIQRLGEVLPADHPLVRYLYDQFLAAAKRAPSLAEQFYRDLQEELRRIGAQSLVAEAVGDVFDDLQAELEARRAYVLRLIIDADVKPAADSVQQELARIAEIQEEVFRRRMAELAARAQEALSPFGPGAVAERLALYRGERVLPPWLDAARRQAIAAGDMQSLAQLAEQHSLVYLDAQIEALDRVIDEMVREIQARTGEVNIYDLLSSPELMGVLRDRSQLAAERAVTAWQYELADIQDELARALDTVEIERLLAAVTGAEFNEAAAKWRAVEQAIWDVVRAGHEHGRTIEEILPLVEQLVGKYGHLAIKAQEAVDPLANIRSQLDAQLGAGLRIEQLIRPDFDPLQFQIDALQRAISRAAQDLAVSGQGFGEIFDQLQPWIEQLQELQRRQREQLAVQDAVNSALDGFAQGLADGNRVVQDFMRLLRWEQGGLRFDMGGLWSLGANLIAQLIGSLFGGGYQRQPEPRTFEAPDPYQYGLAMARGQRAELEAEIQRLEQRLKQAQAAYDALFRNALDAWWHTTFRQDLVRQRQAAVERARQELENARRAYEAFDLSSFLGLDPGSIARAIESGFDMADISRLGQSLEDVIRTALVRAWVTSEEMVRLQTRFRDLLQQVVDEFVQHGELRADALDPLRAVIAAIQERGEAFNEVLRRLGFTTEELNEQFSRMIYNIPQGYRVERAIFEASPPRIPALAAGGIVTRPTLALVGEAGPEAVVPLDRGGIGGVYVHIERMEVQDGTDFGRRLDQELRRRGLVVAGNVTAWRGRR